MQKINILCLHNKKLHDENMDRTFFHGYDAIKRHGDVKSFVYSGMGWDNYDVNKTVSENIEKIYMGKEKPNVVLGFQYYLYRGFKNLNILKVSRADETYKEHQTAQALQKNKIDMVICHHLNGMLSLQRRPEVKGILFKNIPRIVNTDIFKNYQEEKIYDLLLIGKLDSVIYPFRYRLAQLIDRDWKHKYTCKILKHPGYIIHLGVDKDIVMKSYAREINRARIVVSCSSKYRYALSKYLEVPRSMSLLAADLPDERHKFFREHMLVLNTKDSDDTLSRKIKYYLEHDREREDLTKKGYDLISKKRNPEIYANSFVSKIQNRLEQGK